MRFVVANLDCQLIFFFLAVLRVVVAAVLRVVVAAVVLLLLFLAPKWLLSTQPQLQHQSFPENPSQRQFFSAQ